MDDKRMQIKVCGITRLEDAELAIQLGARALGFIFYAKSPRYIAPDRVAAIVNALKPSKDLRLVGVFVNSSAEDIRKIAAESGIDTIQLHGDETAEFCAQLSDLRLWKAFRLRELSQLAEISAYEAIPAIEAFLFDAAVTGQYGGTGHLSDWGLLGQVPRKVPLIVSGGLNPDNVAEAWRRFQPYFLDLSSGVETSPGLKSADKLRSLFAQKGNGPS